MELPSGDATTQRGLLPTAVVDTLAPADGSVARGLAAPGSKSGPKRENKIDCGDLAQAQASDWQINVVGETAGKGTEDGTR
jgi:hypothetical protein